MISGEELLTRWKENSADVGNHSYNRWKNKIQAIKKYKILEIHTIGYHRDEFIDISDEERKIGEWTCNIQM